MTVNRWGMTALVWLLSIGLFFYVGEHKAYHIWGMPVVALNVITWFVMLVNTIDLLFGRWIRPRQAGAQMSQGQPYTVRRVILEEVSYTERNSYVGRR